MQQKTVFLCIKIRFWWAEVDSNLDESFTNPLFTRDSAVIRQSFAKLILCHNILCLLYVILEK